MLNAREPRTFATQSPLSASTSAMLSQPKDVVDEFSKYVKFGE